MTRRQLRSRRKHGKENSDDCKSCDRPLAAWNYETGICGRCRYAYYNAQPALPASGRK